MAKRIKTCGIINLHVACFIALPVPKPEKERERVREKMPSLQFKILLIRFKETGRGEGVREAVQGGEGTVDR